MDLKAYRESIGLTQAETAAALGLRSKGYVSSLETGAKGAGLKLALRIEQWSGGRVSAATIIKPEDASLLKRSVPPANDTHAGAAA